jgi:hypothetical protein
MRKPEGNFPNCLKPHIRGEVITIREATDIAGRSESTRRSYARRVCRSWHGMRRVWAAILAPKRLRGQYTQQRAQP